MKNKNVKKSKDDTIRIGENAVKVKQDTDGGVDCVREK